MQLRAVGSLAQEFHAADWVVDKHLDFRDLHRWKRVFPSCVDFSLFRFRSVYYGG